MQPDGHHLARALFGLLVFVVRIVLDGRAVAVDGRLPARSPGPYDVVGDLNRGVGDRDEMCGVSME